MSFARDSLYSYLLRPVSTVQGVGPALEHRLASRDICCLGDLLLHLPKSYIDDRVTVGIHGLREGLEARTRARVMDVEGSGSGRRRQVLVHLVDDHGDRLILRFFHSGFLLRDARLRPGRLLSIRGIPERRGDVWQMIHPQWVPDELHQGGWQTGYSSLAGIGSQRIGGMINHILQSLPTLAKSPLDSLLPGYPHLKEALTLLHQPLLTNPHSREMKRASERLQIEELLVYLHLMIKRKEMAQIPAARFVPGTATALFIESLPYHLTPAQQQVWAEIRDDLASGRRMHRLLQGDVGAGKTLVAALCMLTACENGMQSAIMAPTEILALQHTETLSTFFRPLGIDVHLMHGGMPARKRKQILTGLSDGSVQVVVGTHALISRDVHFSRLGLAVVDEQHRFGVRQRWVLSERGESVHLLAMTATPIPRSLALALYGDMDLSLMRGMPPGRKPVQTTVVSSRSMSRLAEGMRRILDQQGRIYWIVPRIDDDDVSVRQRSEDLTKQFSKAGVRALHGRLSGKEKKEALDAFDGGDCRILVSTTVVEVGVHVAEANLMIIEQADRYGLAQLHQLRGRVGRQNRQDYCVLIPSESAGKASCQRLRNLCSMHDGLDLAELDLKLRGSGDAMGTRQSGEAEFRLLDPACDAALIRYWHQRLPIFYLDDAMSRFWRHADAGVD